MKCVAGDFFDSVPAGGDLYLLKHIIHDWDDEGARTILSNVTTAMAPGATAPNDPSSNTEMSVFPMMERS